jgi:hypothetical protein
MPKRDVRFLRGAWFVDDEELERTDWVREMVEAEELCSTPTNELSTAWSSCSTVGDISAAFSGVLCATRSLVNAWSLEVRDGADVKLVDCVSCEWIDMELLWSLSRVMVESALEMSWGGQRYR